MYKTGSLLLITIVAVVLMAPPVGSQSNRKVTLEDVMRDVLDLQNYVKEMQRTVDTKNADTKVALDQILARFSSIDSSVQKLGDSLSAIKTEDEKSTRELQEAKTAVKAIKDNLDKLDLGQTLLDIKSGFKGLRDEISNLQNTESPLPTARDAYSSAWGLLNQGFYEDAISEFRDLVKAYPKDPRAAKAQLEIGTAYFTQKKFSQALIEYDLTIQTYPESDTKCTALYKKGLTLVELKQAPQAKEVFQSVVKDCPGTAESSQAAEALKPAARGARGN